MKPYGLHDIVILTNIQTYIHIFKWKKHVLVTYKHFKYTTVFIKAFLSFFSSFSNHLEKLLPTVHPPKKKFQAGAREWGGGDGMLYGLSALRFWQIEDHGNLFCFCTSLETCATKPNFAAQEDVPQSAMAVSECCAFLHSAFSSLGPNGWLSGLQRAPVLPSLWAFAHVVSLAWTRNALPPAS